MLCYCNHVVDPKLNTIQGHELVTGRVAGDADSSGLTHLRQPVRLTPKGTVEFDHTYGFGGELNSLNTLRADRLIYDATL
jgi:hypothetical protein